MYTMLNREEGGLWNGIKSSQPFIFSSVIIYQSILGNCLKWVGVCYLLPAEAVICTMKQEKLYIWYIIQGWNRVGRGERNFLHTVRRAVFSSSEDTDCMMLICWGFPWARNLAAFIQEENSFKDGSVLSLAPGNTHQWATEWPQVCVSSELVPPQRVRISWHCSNKQPQAENEACKMQK